MDASAISALAALMGAATGGLTSVATGWMTQRTLAHAQWREGDKARREELYKDFIEEASRCYIDALQHSQADVRRDAGRQTNGFFQILYRSCIFTQKVQGIAARIPRLRKSRFQADRFSTVGKSFQVLPQ